MFIFSYFIFLFQFGWCVIIKDTQYGVCASHRQQGHLEDPPPFTVPCEGREARFGIEPRAVS